MVGAAPHDAITNMALKTRHELRQTRESEIFALYIAEEIQNLGIRRIDQMDKISRGSTLVYHSSFGVPIVTEILQNWIGPLVLVYHNISPASYYDRFDKSFSEGLSWGRVELSLLKEKVVHAFAMSQFNAGELLEVGYKSISVRPIGLDPFRLDQVPSDGLLIRELNSRFPNGFVLVVSQVLPHKRMELAIEAVHILNTVFERKTGLVIVGPQRQQSYLQELLAFSRSLPNLDVYFAGSVSDTHLATMYRAARCLLSTSDHEGLSVPPLEAMAQELCVIARAAGALPETIQNGGILIPMDVTCPQIAGILDVMLGNQDLQSNLRAAGLRRLEMLKKTDAARSIASEIDLILA